MLPDEDIFRAQASYSRLNAVMSGASLQGPDPYDALTSPFAHLLRSKITRQAWLQLHSRSPAGLRQVTGVRPLRMTKTMALVAEAYGLQGNQVKAEALAGEILSNRHVRELWGYEFDVQTRWAHYSACTPNVIVTAFVVRALDIVGLLRDDELRHSISELFQQEFVHPDGWVRYLHETPTLIHNANALGAATLARLGHDGPTVMAVLEPTLRAQQRDGSWRYGTSSSLSWVDSFHTAYVLTALNDVARIIPALQTQLADPLSGGTRFWLSSMFSNSGTPRYFSDSSRKSQDVHNIATALWALVELNDIDNHSRVVATEVLHSLLRRQGGDGQFRSHAVAPAYMRWNNAHALLALARLLSKENSCIEREES